MTMIAKRVTRLIADMAGGERESLTLTALRDTPPPELISGDLCLPVTADRAGT